MVKLWIAVAVLPLSTVECKQGFSRQNVIKRWQRGAIKDARLLDLMAMSLLDYEPHKAEVVDIWRSYKKRHPGQRSDWRARRGRRKRMKRKGRRWEEEGGELMGDDAEDRWDDDNEDE
ncbi:hypothetical protein CLOM_g17406 [Closterium sp. NIES-68]|nr:hypothetical protein CLOM_g17406 [Closterium sp. NIES-68]